jgi:phage FluMu gp28-like protein
MKSKTIDLFLPYQKRWLADDSKIALWIKSRRIGATYVEALRAVLRRLEYSYDYNFVSANLKTSSEFIAYVKMWCEVINTSMQSEVIDLSDATTEVVRFANGSKIIALSSNSTALRGRSGDVTLDEISFHDRPEELYKASQPVTLWGGTLRLISSVSTPDSFFSTTAARIDAKELDWSLHKTTILDAVAEGLALKVPGDHRQEKDPGKAFIDNLKAEVGNDSAWSQEYLCEPASHSMLITSEAYDAIALEELKTSLDEDGRYGDLFVGIDIGRVKDLSVVWVLERGIDKDAPTHLRDVFRTVAVVSVKGMAFEAQAQLFGTFITNKNVVKCCVDKSGLGMQMAEQLWGEYGSIVDGVSISAPVKQDLVERTIKFISQERVSLPVDEKIKSDIICMRRVVTEKGNISYEGKSSIGHGDHYIALAMALRAADKQSNLSILTSGG